MTDRVTTPSLTRRTRRHYLAALVAAGLRPPAATAQSSADGSIHLVAPVAAGENSDLIARALGAELSSDLSRAVQIDDVRGASGSLASDRVARAPADGRSLLLGSVVTHAINPSVLRRLEYDPIADFTALALVARSPIVIAVDAQAGLRSLSELISRAHTADGELTFGSAGTGSPGHLTQALFAARAGVAMTHVPYKTSARALADLLGGQIPLLFDTLQTVSAHVRAGRLDVLAVCSAQRAPALPQTPTLRESGFAEIDASAWWAVYGPARLPASLTDLLQSSLERIVRADSYRARLARLGIDPVLLPDTTLIEFERAELLRWADAARAARLVPN